MNDPDMIERTAMTSLAAAYNAVKDAPPGVGDLALLGVAAAVVATATQADPNTATTFNAVLRFLGCPWRLVQSH